MNPDLIICWPQHLDYPLWRQFIRENRADFDKVIIIFTQMNTTTGDYREFVRQSTLEDDIIIKNNDPVSAEQDWRDVATNKALWYSNNEWVFFTEQDFFINKPADFWHMVKDLTDKNFEAIAYLQGDRAHPCCFFIKRHILETKTKKNFSVIPDVSDHFSRITADLERKGIPIGYLKDTETRDIVLHMNALSQNMFMMQQGKPPEFDAENFLAYLRQCLEARVPLDTGFVEQVEEYLKK